MTLAKLKNPIDIDVWVTDPISGLGRRCTIKVSQREIDNNVDLPDHIDLLGTKLANALRDLGLI